MKNDETHELNLCSVAWISDGTEKESGYMSTKRKKRIDTVNLILLAHYNVAEISRDTLEKTEKRFFTHVSPTMLSMCNTHTYKMHDSSIKFQINL